MARAHRSTERRRVWRIAGALTGLLVAVVTAAVWRGVQVQRDSARANAVNGELRGSVPPRGVAFPNLHGVRGLTPRFPRADDVRGRPVVVYVTCVACRSGDIVGRYLGSMTANDVPAGAAPIIVAWGGDSARWARSWQLTRADAPRFRVIEARGDVALRAVRRTFGIATDGRDDASGAAFVYDTRGRWRSTFFLGQLNRDDIAHDLRRLDP